MSVPPSHVGPADSPFAFSTRPSSPKQQSTKKQLDGGFISDGSDDDNAMGVDRLHQAPVAPMKQHVLGLTGENTSAANERQDQWEGSIVHGEAGCGVQATASADTHTEPPHTITLDDNDEVIAVKPPMAAKKGVARPAAKSSVSKASASKTPIGKTPATTKRKASATTPAEPTETPMKKKARKSEGKAESMAVPTTYEEMTEPDRMMWEERKRGKPWVEICARWREMTGQNVATTTLPNRFTRIKEFIGDFSKEDDKLMMRCKRDLEDTWSREIWALTAEQMVVKGGMKYSAGTIERRYRELMADQEPEEEGEAGDEDDAMDEGDGGVTVG